MRGKAVTCRYFAASAAVHALAVAGCVAWYVRTRSAPREEHIPVEVAVVRGASPVLQRVERVVRPAPVGECPAVGRPPPGAGWATEEGRVGDCAEAGPEPVPPEVAPPPLPEPVCVEGRPDEIALQVRPEYPRRERERGVEGVVKVRVTAGPAGEMLTAALVASSGSQALDSSALDAARRTAFRKSPATERIFNMEFNFVLTGE